MGPLATFAKRSPGERVLCMQMLTHPPTGPLQTAQVNGIPLAYLDTGEPKPVVLLLHGGYVSHREWQYQIPELRKRYRVIAPDLRAHGHSGRNGRPYSVEQFAQDILALLDMLGVSDAHVCGHSLGGMVAMQLALTHPQRVLTLVLAETSYGTRSTRLEAIMTDWTRPMFRIASIQWQARLFARSLAKHTPGIHGYLEEEVLKYVDDREAYVGIWDAVISFDGQARLAQLRQPSLIVVGERNRQTHAQGRTFASQIPNARLEVLPRAGHMLNMDQPSEFNSLLLNFWAGYEAEATNLG